MWIRSWKTDLSIRKLLELCVPLKSLEFQIGRLLIWMNFVPEGSCKSTENERFSKKNPTACIPLLFHSALELYWHTLTFLVALYA